MYRESDVLRGRPSHPVGDVASMFRKARVSDAQVHETGSARALIEPIRVDGVPL
jgi:hypothetical protein